MSIEANKFALPLCGIIALMAIIVAAMFRSLGWSLPVIIVLCVFITLIAIMIYFIYRPDRVDNFIGKICQTVLCVLLFSTVAIFTLSILLNIGIFVVQPIGIIPDGVTIVYRRSNTSMPFIASADSLLIKANQPVTPLTRAVVLAALSEELKEMTIARFSYSEILYLISTNGKKFDY